MHSCLAKWSFCNNTEKKTKSLSKISTINNWGTGIRGLMRGMATFPQGNRELLMVRDKVGKPPCEQVHGM